MEHRRSPQLTLLADDLSGALEVAAPYAGRGWATVVRLTPRSRTAQNAQLLPGGPTVDVWDLQTREATPATTERRVSAALRVLRAKRPDTRPFVKLDSLLRGNVAATVAALRPSATAPVVLAPALPALGRTVVDGVVRVDGLVLHETTLWRAERARPPRSVPEALGRVPCAVVPLAEVRAGSARLRSTVRSVAESGRVAVCDAQSDDDLDRLVAAVGDLPAARLAGSSALGAALARSLSPPPLPSGPPAEEPGTPAVLVVVGTAAESAATQVDHLVQRRATRVAVGEQAVGHVVRALASGPVVLQPAPTRLTPARRDAVLSELAGTAAQVVRWAGSPVDLVLTGGQTARAVLDRLEVAELHVHGQLEHGAVLGCSPAGMRVVTRPGSFGGPSSLVDIVDALTHPTRTPLPTKG